MSHILHPLEHLETLFQYQIKVTRPARFLLLTTSSISIIVGVLLTIAGLESLSDSSIAAFIWFIFGWFFLWLGITTRRKVWAYLETVSWQRADLQIAPMLVLIGLVLMW